MDMFGLIVVAGENLSVLIRLRDEIPGPPPHAVTGDV